MTDHKTIAAIATPAGTGGISVIRVSGPEAFAICDRIFYAPGGAKLAEAVSHTVHYGHIREAGRVIDEVLVSVFRAPRSFTTEDTVEISCHGGLTVTRTVLEALIRAGAVLASPGEFTKRAFLSGRLDLSQAEAVIDVIQAPSSLALELAVNQLEGSLSSEINEVREQLLELLAVLDAAADYPEEEIAEYDNNELTENLHTILAEVDKLLKSADRGKWIRDGIDTVIIGRPNVGKSSLLNALAEEERVIVTEITGTTRDVIEQRVTLSGAVLNVFDTAGIHETADTIENLGIKKTRDYLNKAELVLLVIDACTGLTEEDLRLAQEANCKPTVLVVNKADLLPGNSRPPLALDGARTIWISAKTGDGIPALAQEIERLFSLGQTSAVSQPIITNLRHKEALLNAKSFLSSALQSIQAGVPADIASVELKDAVASLGEITGQTISDEIIDRIFSRFCLGK